MPTKKKPKKKSRNSTSSSSVAIDPAKYPVNLPPTTQISAPYEYPDTRMQASVYTRTPDNQSVAWTENYTGSKTETTLIGTVGADSILVNYNLSANLVSGSTTGFNRFRLEIVRGGTTIFAVSIILSQVPSTQSLASNANIVLKEGDVINLVSRPQNATAMLYYVWGSVMLQPYR